MTNKLAGMAYTYLREDSKKKILFLHGNSHSRKTFSSQFNSDVFKDYALVSCDLFGHGDSEKIDEYSLINYALKISEFINRLDLRDYIIVGHSLGGHIANHLLACDKLKTSPLGILLFGTPPVAKLEDFGACFLNPPEMELLYKNNLSEAELEQLVSVFHHQKFESQSAKNDISKVDENFKNTFMANTASGKFVNEVEQLSSFSGKMAVLHGEYDQFISLDYISQLKLPLWRGSVQVVKNSGHNIHSDAPQEFNKLVSEFLEDCY